VESNTGIEKVTFGDLQARLIQLVNGRIQNGDFTERGLARILGISQPQIHNVLKGARKLNPELADRLLAKLGMDITDLLMSPELSNQIILRHSACTQCPNRPVQILGGHLSPTKSDEAPGIPRKAPGRATPVALPYRQQAS
jgi:transcriptional regulator with XRE-family HTH domain